MIKEWADKWVVALRSGKYKQSRGNLCDNDGFCCLGVLCDIVDSSKWKLQNSMGVYSYDEKVGTLPSSIVNVVGMNSNDGCIDFTKVCNNKNLGKILNSKVQLTLAEFNDKHCLSFNEIADVIESNYAAL